jgi:uncharacterized membrane protein
MRRGGWTDEQVEQLLGWVLQLGVVLAALVGLIGGTAYLLGHGPQPYDYRIFRGEPADLRSLGGIVRGVSRLDARDVAQLCVVFLLATPITRVALSALAFARQRDGTYVLVTSFVLVLLLVGLLGV